MAHPESKRKLAMVFIASSIAWIAILFIESSQPPAAIMGEVSGLDKVAHFMAFGVLVLLVYGVTSNIRPESAMYESFIPVVIVTIIGITDELYQLSNPSRAFELLDLLADISGAVISLSLFRFIFKRRLGRRYLLSK
ncbi:VanZ family protein [Methylomonas methanica]|uniref:VanZ-like domain-containing protein n=1 Tax=Methylomonas methanica TaxID=421 RepID=A0A177MG68_METMH|nr:VanZ family protein [Methylomonas methanica]OAI04494.1 hypothetical protein A1332_01985 [Methylomonas methanica]